MLLALVLACAPKPVPVVEAPPPAPVEHVPPQPSPLPARPFVVPSVAEGKLENGARVAVVENHEAPLVSLTLSFAAGGLADPAGKTGLAAATLDMMNEGAGKRDAVGISAELRRLGASLGTSSGTDGSSLSVSCLRDKLEPTLDLLADVLLRPTFPEKDWSRIKQLWIDDLAAARASPARIADRVMNRVLFGDSYRGRRYDETSLAKIGVKDMKAWHKANLSPAQTLVLVGGDITLGEVVPLLDARLGGWTTPPAKLPPRPATPPLGPTTVHLVDKPDAPQSVIRAAAYLARPGDPDWMSLSVANTAIGGQFASRINLNLREKQGFTYGARTSLGYDLAGGSWGFSSNIRTDATGPALVELFKELREARGERPLVDKEVDEGRGAAVNGYALRFETPDYLLGQVDAMWTYELPADWVSGYLDRARSVTTASAQSAFSSRVDPDKLALVVVGSAAAVRPQLEALGLPVVLHDVDGNVIGER